MARASTFRDARRVTFARGLTLALLAGVVLTGSGCGDSEPATLPPPDVHQGEIAKAKRELRAERKLMAERRAELRKAAKSTPVDGGVDGFLATLPGEAGLAVGRTGGEGPSMSGGDLDGGSAWSTIKVPIAQRVLTDAGGPSQLTSEQKSQITAALTLSDNDAAAALFSGLEQKYGSLTEGSEAVGEMLGLAGDSKTVISTEGRDSFSTYGQTDWSLAEQNRYMAALAGMCLGDRESSEYLLEQMSNVTSDTWGLGSIGTPARWKGGWGPGVDGRYLVRQMGVVDGPAGNQMVVTLAAIPDDGTFETGQAMASQIAVWALANLADSPELQGQSPCPDGTTP